MSHWLDPVRRALDGSDAARSRPVFFRDDDAGWDDPALARLLGVFDRHQVTIDLAVIPEAVGSSGLLSLLGPRLAAGTVRIHQHGWSHDNHEPEGRRCEFGPSRSRHDQQRSLVAGAQRLAAAFGPHVDPVFTPPWNRCTAVTGELLVELGWRILSRDHTAPALDQPGLTEVPVTFDWFGRTRGERWDRGERGRRLAASLSAPGPTGVMLHHGVTGPDDLTALDELVGLLASHPAVSPTSILAAGTATRETATRDTATRDTAGAGGRVDGVAGEIRL